MKGRLWAAAARLLVLAFCWATALYAFIASSAYAYLQFIKPRVFWWLGAFSDIHTEMSWVWLGALLVALRADLRRGARAAGAARVLVAVAAASVGWNTVRPVLPALHDGAASVVVGLAALAPVLLLALVDHVRAWPHLKSQDGSSRDVRQATEGRLFITAVASALVVTAAYALLTTLSIGGAFEPDLDSSALAIGAASALVGHLLVFCAAFVGMAVALRIGDGSVSAQYLVVLAAATALFTIAFATVAGRAIGLTGASGLAAASGIGASLACAWGGLRLRAHAEKGTTLPTGVDVFLEATRASGEGRGAALAIAAVLPVAWVLAYIAGRFDWDFALAKSGVIVVWIVTFVTVFRVVAPRDTPAWLVFVACAAPLALHVAWKPDVAHGHALQRYAVHNPSFRLLDRLLREPRESRAFDRFLRANTGLTDQNLAPRSIDIVPSVALSRVENPPHVFLFVIDSLRADYLAPYNPEVRFTPRIDAFARENVAFRNAFTAYGGTGMSMPAIWAGSVLAHKQYVLPFAPMNALEKLLTVNGYQRMMTGGFINDTLWTKQAGDIWLQSGVDEMDFEFCPTVEEIAQRLADRTTAAPPVFAQTLPQDLHVATIRDAPVLPGRAYPGFDAPYASRVERIDGCFGAFVERLKQLGLYDNSLVILTADHGDLLGEDGQWGHSYHLYPEVVQVPLLVHLPRGAELDADVADAVYSVDITPTIYAASGYATAPPGPLAGRALARRTASGLDADRGDVHRTGPDHRVIAASYGAVYAVVSRNGRELYIADAVQGQARAYERTSPTDRQWSEAPIDVGRRVVAELRIRRHIDAISAAWGLDRPF